MGICYLLEKIGQIFFEGSFVVNQCGLVGLVIFQIVFISLKEFYLNVREILFKKLVWLRQFGFWWCMVKCHLICICLFKIQWKIKMRNFCSEFKIVKMQLNMILLVIMVKILKDYDNLSIGKRINEVLSLCWNFFVSGFFLS